MPHLCECLELVCRTLDDANAPNLRSVSVEQKNERHALESVANSKRTAMQVKNIIVYGIALKTFD